MENHNITQNKKFVLDIGCGAGYFLEYYWQNYNNQNIYLTGVELQKEFYEKAANRIKRLNMTNCEVFLGDIKKFLISTDDININETDIIKKNSDYDKNNDEIEIDEQKKITKINRIKFDEIHINFPDPWFKLKHSKRILCQPSFLNILSNHLKKNGFISIVTDVYDLCIKIITGVEKLQSIKNVYLPAGFKINLPFSSETNFYKKAKKNNSNVYFIKLEKNISS